MARLNLITWDWNSQEVDGDTVYLLTKLMPDNQYYIFAGFDDKDGRLWTLDRSKAIVFPSDLAAQLLIKKYFVETEHNKLLIVKEV